MHTLPLFEHYPALEAILKPQDFATLPTPLEPITAINNSTSSDISNNATANNLSASGFPTNAWIKRDDLTHTEYGGNKIRKLDFVLSDIRKKKKQHVITFGATGTNAGVATAMMCHRNNLDCTVYLFDQPETETVKKNYQLMQKYGAQLIHKGSLFKTVLSFYLSPYRLKSDSYFLWAGCSNDVATFAYINAAFELAEQIKQQQALNSELESIEPENIFVPVGSCSTLAGLTLGCKLAGLKSNVIGIRVAPAYLGPFPACTEGEVNKVILKAHQQMVDWGVTDSTSAPSCIFDDSFYGSGYGEATPESEAAIKEFHNAGIKLENTYSAKAAAAFLAQTKRSDKVQLFWNTFNSREIPVF